MASENKKFYMKSVQVGRVVMVTFGPFTGQLAVIVEIIDHQRVLVEGPKVTRQALGFKRLALTDIVLDIPRAIGCQALQKKLKEQDLEGKWAATAWAKKIQKRQVRTSLSDFDRFKLMLAKKKKNAIVGQSFAKLRKTAA
jgi:large subunit ribosomal protein L14e